MHVLTLSFSDPAYRIALAGLVAIVVAASAALAWPAGRAFPQMSLADPEAATARAANDASRAEDLDWLTDSLTTHAQLHGAFPSTLATITTVCSSLSDPACALWHIDGAMYASDGATPYYYQSQGTAYTLFARTDGSADPAKCPKVLPPGFTPGYVICRSGRLGAR